MSEILGNLSQAVVIASFVAAAFSYVVLRPLRATLDSLTASVAALKDELRYNQERREVMQERLAKVEAAASSAHHRLDTMDDRLNLLAKNQG